MALEYLKDGTNPEKYSSVGQKLQKSPEFIQKVVETVVFFLIQSVTKVSSIETLNDYGLSNNHMDILAQLLQKQNETISKLLASNSSSLHFRDLEWRLETRVASRALLQQMTPQITVKLHLDHETVNENKEKLLEEGRERELSSSNNDHPSTQRQIVMQVDPGCLRTIIQTLDEALLEDKTHRTRLFCRAFQNKD